MIVFPAPRSAYRTHIGRKRSYPDTREPRCSGCRRAYGCSNVPLGEFLLEGMDGGRSGDRSVAGAFAWGADERPAPLLVLVPGDGIVILTINPGGKWARSSPRRGDKLVPDRVPDTFGTSIANPL
jgi:hypothetical protein